MCKLCNAIFPVSLILIWLGLAGKEIKSRNQNSGKLIHYDSYTVGPYANSVVKRL